MLNNFRIKIIETTVKECEVYMTAKDEQQAEELARTVYESFIDTEDWQDADAGGVEFDVEKCADIQYSIIEKESDK